jgi:hypothetical protein
MVAYDLKNDYDNEFDNNFDENIITESNTNVPSNSAFNDLINTNPEQKYGEKLDTAPSTKITLSSILNKHKGSVDESEQPSLDKLSSLLKSSEETPNLPYTNYIIGSSIFLIVCIGLYYLYVYVIEHKLLNQFNNFFNPPKNTPNKENPKEKKTNYKKEGFENNIKGLDKAINGGVNKNALNKDVKVFNSDNDSVSENKVDNDEASSNIQSSLVKERHCYIGTDRGFRSCIKIGDADKCMSGDIFPTQEMCINPSLRQ